MQSSSPLSHTHTHTHSLSLSLSSRTAQTIPSQDQPPNQYQVIISHVTLLAAPILPLLHIYPSPCSSAPAISRYIGLIVIGVGDSMGAICGVTFGRRRIPFNGSSKRTIVGSTACFVSILFCAAAVNFASGESFTISNKDVLASLIVTGIEAGTDSIDNLALPMVAALAWGVDAVK